MATKTLTIFYACGPITGRTEYTYGNKCVTKRIKRNKVLNRMSGRMYDNGWACEDIIRRGTLIGKRYTN